MLGLFAVGVRVEDVEVASGKVEVRCLAGGSIVESVSCISDLLLIERVRNIGVAHEIVLQGGEVDGGDLQNGTNAGTVGMDIGVGHGCG